MNINPEKVKELILIYSELDDEHKQELMAHAYSLKIKQAQLEQIRKEKIKFKTDKDLQEEVNKRGKNRAERIVNIMDVFEKMNDTDKAALFMMINQLSGDGNIVKESDITISINQKETSIKDYLEKYLFDANYDKAKEKVIGFFNDENKS